MGGDGMGNGSLQGGGMEAAERGLTSRDREEARRERSTRNCSHDHLWGKQETGTGNEMRAEVAEEPQLFESRPDRHKPAPLGAALQSLLGIPLFSAQVSLFVY